MAACCHITYANTSGGSDVTQLEAAMMSAIYYGGGGGVGGGVVVVVVALNGTKYTRCRSDLEEHSGFA